MSDPITPRKSAHNPRRKKPRCHIWFEATVQNDRGHMEFNALTKWFRVLRLVFLIAVLAFVLYCFAR